MDQKLKIYSISKHQILANDGNGQWYRAIRPLDSVKLGDIVSSKDFEKVRDDENESYNLALGFRKIFQENPSLF